MESSRARSWLLEFLGKSVAQQGGPISDRPYQPIRPHRNQCDTDHQQDGQSGLGDVILDRPAQGHGGDTGSERGAGPQPHSAEKLLRTNPLCQLIGSVEVRRVPRQVTELTTELGRRPCRVVRHFG